MQLISVVLAMTIDSPYGKPTAVEPVKAEKSDYATPPKVDPIELEPLETETSDYKPKKAKDCDKPKKPKVDPISPIEGGPKPKGAYGEKPVDVEPIAVDDCVDVEPIATVPKDSYNTPPTVDPISTLPEEDYSKPPTVDPISTLPTDDYSTPPTVDPISTLPTDDYNTPPTVDPIAVEEPTVDAIADLPEETEEYSSASPVSGDYSEPAKGDAYSSGQTVAVTAVFGVLMMQMIQ